MSYTEAKEKYAALGVDTEAALTKLKTVPLSLHCWQGDDVRGFDTDPTKPLTGGIQTTGSYPGRARTPQELMADIAEVLKLCPGTKKLNLHASYAILPRASGSTAISWSRSILHRGWTSAKSTASARTSTRRSSPTLSVIR